MAEAEQKQKLYTPKGFAKLTPTQKAQHEAQAANLLPEGWMQDFDVNSDHAAWAKFMREAGVHFEAMFKGVDGPNKVMPNAFKRTVISPIAGDLTCECTVYEPIEDAKDKFLFIYVHGGGMCFFDGKGPLEWGPAFYAMDGHIGATVHFTNSTEECYPRGLNDTISAIKYLVEKYKDQVKGVCLHGESGGANLVIAAMMKLTQDEPDKSYVDLLYAECPFLYPIQFTSEDKFATPEDIKGSIDEFALKNPSHALACIQRGTFLCYKGPNRDDIDHLQDKFAWPYFATEEDFKNFPVTYVQDNECDMLKDVGLRFYRQLIGAGVKAYHSVEGGTMHAGEKFDMLYNKLILKRRATVLSAVIEDREQQAAQALAKEE